MPEFVRVQNSDFRQLDLHSLLINSPESTFILRAARDFTEEMVFKNDLLVVDKSLLSKKGDLVIVQTSSSFVLRKCSKQEKVWGKVKCVIHTL